MAKSGRWCLYIDPSLTLPSDSCQLSTLNKKREKVRETLFCFSPHNNGDGFQNGTAPLHL